MGQLTGWVRPAAFRLAVAGIGAVLVACAAGSEAEDPPAPESKGGSAGSGNEAQAGFDGESGGAGGGGDCTDSEICGDGIDNDCNDLIDDDCPCEPGTSRECYGGDAANAGVGICAMGTQYCPTDAEFPMWGPCEGWLGPASEVCDADMLDEDCNGVPNDACECIEGETVPCGTDVGECVAGEHTCVNGVLGPCVGEVGPSVETCNNLDDDCDNVIDGLSQACGTNTGECQQGSSTCTAGIWGSCVGEIGPTSETCNNADDDCDNATDEGLSQTCGTNVGECTQGTEICTAGLWGGCTATGPFAETCNTLDDDCDGTPDEGCNCVDGTTQPCGTNTGECSEGSQTCSGGMWGMCVGAIGPTSEVCDNQDDDCDGPIDENLTQSCGTNVGECQSGTETCSGGAWGSCVGEIGPSGETCDNQDDDCDGIVDDGLTQQCGITDVGVCQYGTSTCSMGMWGGCAGAINPVTEVCGNGLDDDCDGTADELAECPDFDPECTCPASPITANVLDTLSLAASCSDPDGGAVVYDWQVTAAPIGSSSQPSAPNSATTPFFLDLAGHYTVTLYVTDNENNTVIGCIVDITANVPQDLHIELVWDTAWGDADLHMIAANLNPATYWFIPEPDCFFNNTNAAWPPNGPNGNATLDIDDTDGYGPENININTSPQNGTYNIGVEYFCSHSIQQMGEPPIASGDGPASATVNVYCGGGLIASYPNIDLDRTGRFVHVATVSWPGCVGMSVSNETWVALVQPAAYTSPLHCQLPCGNDNDCGGGEQCGPLGYCILD